MSLLPTGFEAQVESPARGKEAGCAMASNPGTGNASKKGRDFYAMLGVEKTANQVSVQRSCGHTCSCTLQQNLPQRVKD